MYCLQSHRIKKQGNCHQSFSCPASLNFFIRHPYFTLRLNNKIFQFFNVRDPAGFPEGLFHSGSDRIPPFYNFSANNTSTLLSCIADSECLSRIRDPKTATKEEREKIRCPSFFVATNIKKLKLILLYR
jgi:hypothetical protein